MCLLVELYQLQLSFKLILCKWSTFLSGTVYSLQATTRPGNCAFRLHTHNERVSSCIVLLGQSYRYLHYLDWVIMFCRISFHAQNTAENENAVLTLRAFVLCDTPFLKNYEFRLNFHVE